MKTKLIKIGNSRGVRIPKVLLEQSGLEGPVRLRVVEGGILVEAEKPIRQGWAEAASSAHERGDDQLLDVPIPTDFESTEWEWE